MPYALQPEDAVIAAPRHHKILFENEAVRILETRIASGDVTPAHTHQWPAALYVLSWSAVGQADPTGRVMFDSRSLNNSPAERSALWSPSVPLHSISNVGPGELLIISSEVKCAGA